MDKTWEAVILHCCLLAWCCGAGDWGIGAPSTSQGTVIARHRQGNLIGSCPETAWRNLLVKATCRKNSFSTAQTYPLSLVSTVASNTAWQVILIKHLWKSNCHKWLGGLLLPYTLPFQVSHKNQQFKLPTLTIPLTPPGLAGQNGKWDKERETGWKRQEGSKTKHKFFFSLGHHIMLK